MARAAMPAAGYRRPDRVDPSGLKVSVIGTDGTELGPFDFAAAPAHGQVRTELIAAFVAATGSDGRWRSASSMGQAHSTTLTFLRSLDRLGIDITSMAQFGPEAWWTWRADRESSNRWPGQINIMRVLLKGIPEVGPLTRRALTQRTHKPRQRLYGSYPVAEFEAIRRRAAELVRIAEARISANVAALQEHRRGQGGPEPTVRIGDRTLTRGALLEQLQTEGRLTFGTDARSITRDVAALLGTGDLHPTYALYPTRPELLSVMVLLVCDRGYNLSTLQSLEVPDRASAAGVGADDDPVFVAHLDKPRRGHRRYFTNSFAGAHAHTLQRALTLTEPARVCLAGLGHPTSRLLIAGTSHGVTDHPTRIFVTDGYTRGGSVRRWEQVAALTTDQGEVLMLHFNRLRLSEQVINRKSSQNTDTVSEDVYRRPDALTAHLLQDVILDGQADAVAHAEQTLRMRYTSHLPDLHLPPSTAQDVADGKLDTAVGACLDFTHSPFTADGHACTASFLLCLACPNAVATPAHLPRLLLLADALDNLASVNPVRFDRLYREHRHRLEHLLTTRATEPDRAAARRATTDTDRTTIERLLRRDLDA